MRVPLVLAVALLAAVRAAPLGAAGSQEVDDVKKYEDCMALARRAPERGFDTALAWRGLGGGDAAEHCLAVALIGLKQYAEAARRLEALAQRTKGRPALRAGLLAQAAQAWLGNGNAGRAEGALTAALGLKSGDSELFVDRAEARAALGRYRDAVKDLDRAIALNPARADPFVFRASAERLLGRLDKAEADAEHALALDGGHIEALLERGIVRRLKGDNAGARRDWMKILRLAPKSPAAEAARLNLEKMDVKTD